MLKYLEGGGGGGFVCLLFRGIGRGQNRKFQIGM